MTRILAIAQLTLRTAVRSRLILILLLLLLATVVGLPLAVRGDGTLDGYVQVVVAYSLGFAGTLAALAAVWAGCAAISTEINGRQIHLVVTKPVSTAEIWLGKWLGLLALNAAMLLVIGGAVYGMLRWQTRPARLSERDQHRLHEEVLVARAVLPPVEAGVKEEALSLLRDQAAKGEKNTRAISQAMVRDAMLSVTARRRWVPSGGRREFVFHLPFRPDPARPLFLHIRLLKSALDMNAVQGRWTAGPTGTDRLFERETAILPIASQTVEIPASALRGGRELVVGFDNLDPKNMSVLFDPEGGMELLVWKGGFGGNLTRALTSLFGQLALLSAIGLSAGGLLSLPVASFAALTLLGLMKMSRFIGQISVQDSIFFDLDKAGPGQAAFEHLLRVVFGGLSIFLRPLQSQDILGDLASGRLIAPGAVWATAGIQGVLYSLLLGALAMRLMRRRELGLPQEGA